MDESHPFMATGHALQGPHKDPRQPEVPLGFVPLELRLLPSGPSVLLDRPDMLIGRHSEADIRLALPDVSRRHCRCTFQHGFWKVIDLNSRNGVFVNGERMQEATLYDGDHLRLGAFTFSVHVAVLPSILPLPGRDAGNRNGPLEQNADILPEKTELDERKAS